MIRRDSSGVTLVELAVILVILTICAGITMQGAGLLQGALGAGRAKGAADVISQAVRSARQRAITDSQDYCVAVRAAGQYQIYTGARSGTTCTGTSVEGPANLPGGATIGADVAFRFTPVSTVDPIGPTDIVVTSTTEGTTCSVTLTVTPEGGTQLPGTTC
jgi:Tfp pilus assembly protein FimT